MTQKSESPHKKFVFDLLRLLHKKKGTDLFLCAGAPAKIKVDNDLKSVTPNVLTPAIIRELVNAVIDEKKRASLEVEFEANFALSLPNIARFRVNVYYQRGAPSMVIRLINSEIPTLESLKLPEILKDLIMTKRGLLIIVGGTGTGKSTTLASMIDYRNRNSKGHIITIEDPVEFVHKHASCIVSQREVGTDTLNWENALVNTLRQAPDVILIGEVRNSETMEHAIAFAQTGHLCLCTLHANNSYQALERILNFFPHEKHTQLFSDLSTSLRGIISQRLIPAAAGGRVAAVEVMVNTPLISDFILKNNFDSIPETMSRTKEAGNLTFDNCLVDLVAAGSISYEDALKNSDSATEVKVKLRSQGIKAPNQQSNDSTKSLNLN